jgi:hypothetical protein
MLLGHHVLMGTSSEAASSILTAVRVRDRTLCDPHFEGVSDDPQRGSKWYRTVQGARIRPNLIQS